MSTTRVGAPTEPALELERVSAGYGTIEVLHGVDFRLPSGAVVALLGPNGAGKSTLLKVCAGLLVPTRGRVRLAGQVVNGTPAEDLARRGVCTVPEGRGVFPNLTVRENLWLDTQVGMSLKRVEEITCERFPRLTGKGAQRAGTLSGGEQQMLAVARALVTRPTVLLVDELSAGLAPRVASELYGIVAGLAHEGVAVLVVEQLARTVLGVADYAAVMAQGRLLAFGAPADVEHVLASAYLSATAVAP